MTRICGNSHVGQFSQLSLVLAFVERSICVCILYTHIHTYTLSYTSVHKRMHKLGAIESNYDLEKGFTQS